MMMDDQSCPNDSTCVQVAAVGDGRPALLARQEILHHQDDQFGGKSGRLGAMYPAPAGEADVSRESYSIQQFKRYMKLGANKRFSFKDLCQINEESEGCKMMMENVDKTSTQV